MTPALEFAVSLIFVYLLLSALSSAIQESIANLAKWRSDTLEAGITQLLGSKQLKDAVYNHTLIQGILRPSWLFMEVSKFHKPGYISSSMFAQVVQDLQTNEKFSGDLDKVLKFVVKAEDTAEEKKKKIENWFDDAMDGVSGWYKRKAHAWLWVIAVAICLAVNADTISIGKMLWNDPTARAAMADAAKQYASDYAEKNPQQPPADPNAKPSAQELQAEFQAKLARVQEARQSLTGLPVPLGWCRGDCKSDPRQFPTDLETFLLKIVGILISVLAVSQGAPFWFDLLQKVVNLRLAGDPPPDSRTQKAS